MRLVEAVTFGCVPVIVQVGGRWGQGKGAAQHVLKPAVCVEPCTPERGMRSHYRQAHIHTRIPVGPGGG